MTIKEYARQELMTLEWHISDATKLLKYLNDDDIQDCPNAYASLKNFSGGMYANSSE